MIRGAVDVATTKRVAGWIVVEGRSLKGKPVLAFSGRRCVGAGTVSVYREDIEDVGLGDGFAGFDFPIELVANETTGSVVVRLELCDAVLLQAESHVSARPAEPLTSVVRSVGINPLPPLDQTNATASGHNRAAR